MNVHCCTIIISVFFQKNFFFALFNIKVFVRNEGKKMNFKQKTEFVMVIEQYCS